MHSCICFLLVSLSGRELPLRSFGKAPDPETIGTSTVTDSLDNKLYKVRKVGSKSRKIDGPYYILIRSVLKYFK